MLIIVERLKFTGVVVMICANVFFVASPPTLAASGEVNSLVRVYVDSTGVRRIALSDGQDVKVSKEKGEVDSSAAIIADDKQSAGWLVYEENNCCTSYPIPTMLMIYRPASPLLRLGGGRMICAWHFAAGGKQVAFYTNTVHGDLAPHYELHNVRTGRLVEKADGHLNEKSPAWTDGLE